MSLHFTQSWLEAKELKSWLLKNKNKATHVAYCKVYDLELKVSAGKKDLMNHSHTEKHKNKQKILASQPQIADALLPATGLKKNVINAELAIAAYCVE